MIEQPPIGGPTLSPYNQITAGPANGHCSAMPLIEITRIAKRNGPLTKQIFLSPEGNMTSDGSACTMSAGAAKRLHLSSLKEFADLIASLDPNEAIATGALRSDLPDEVEITTKKRLDQLNGQAAPNVIARTGEHIRYQPDQPALALIDVDTKGMPHEVKARIAVQGGFWPALLSVLPELSEAGRVTRQSTSSGISRADTGAALPGSDGLHIYILIRDGSDVERFLRTLHDRCWLAGLGWFVVGASGQLLERSLIDRMVYAPERLVFEGAPVLVAPLVQDLALRKPSVQEGVPLDTATVCPPLRLADQATLKRLKAQAGHELAPQRAEARERFVSERADVMANAKGISRHAARHIVERQCEGTLLPDVVLPWDDPDLAGCTVGDVLNDPARFVGATLADPLEGITYGACKATVMRRPDGTLWIHSFAHGRTVYELRLDAKVLGAILDSTTDDDLVAVFSRQVVNADLSEVELEQLRNRVSDRAKVNKRTLDRAINAARADHAAAAKQAEKDRRDAKRKDPRPQIPAPLPDAPWLPQMRVLNDVLGRSRAIEPPMRDPDGVLTQVRVRRIPKMHLLTSDESNEDGTEETRLPAPEQPLLTRLDVTSPPPRQSFEKLSLFIATAAVTAVTVVTALESMKILGRGGGLSW